MKSLADLAELRQKAQASLNLREGNEDARVIVAMGTCGIAAGARDILAAIMEEIHVRGLQRISVTQTGCLGRCANEPMVIVEMDGQKITYGNLDPEKARKIVASHLVNKTICSEWVL